MSSAVPEDKGDKNQVLLPRCIPPIKLYFLLTMNFDDHKVLSKTSFIKFKAKGYSMLAIYSLSPLHLVESCTLNKDFKPIN